MGRRTPWGEAQDAKLIARGITLYSTAGHGGIHLDEPRYNSMPDALRNIETYAGRFWYEEDCDVNIVVLAFPQFFSDYQVFCAVEMVRGEWCPDYMHAARDWLEKDPKGSGIAFKARVYRAENGHKFQWGSQCTTGQGWHVRATNLARTEALAFDISSEGLYRLTTPFSFEDLAAAGATNVRRATLEKAA